MADLSNTNVAELDVIRLAVILKSNVSFQWPVFHRPLIELRVGDLLPIEFDLKVTADACHHHPIPLMRRS